MPRFTIKAPANCSFMTKAQLPWIFFGFGFEGFDTLAASPLSDLQDRWGGNQLGYSGIFQCFSAVCEDGFPQRSSRFYQREIFLFSSKCKYLF